MSVDARTGLPIALKKYLPDSVRMGKKRDCLEEVRFQWNKPIPQELFVPDFTGSETSGSLEFGSTRKGGCHVIHEY